jgi:hypothetical protein
MQQCDLKSGKCPHMITASLMAARNAGSLRTLQSQEIIRGKDFDKY